MTFINIMLQVIQLNKTYSQFFMEQIIGMPIPIQLALAIRVIKMNTVREALLLVLPPLVYVYLMELIFFLKMLEYFKILLQIIKLTPSIATLIFLIHNYHLATTRDCLLQLTAVSIKKQQLNILFSISQNSLINIKTVQNQPK